MKILIEPTECYSGPGAAVTIEGTLRAYARRDGKFFFVGFPVESCYIVDSEDKTRESDAWYASWKESKEIEEDL